MQYCKVRGTLLRLGPAIVAMVVGLSPVDARDASLWVTDSHAQVRLVAGTNTPQDTPWRAGLDIRLEPGWKTYWRYPGDSGVPPRFDFDGSHNVKSVNVLWPAPERMADGGGQSIGYHNRVIMPLQVVPTDPAKPALVHLKLSFAVCDNLCVPAEATTQLELTPARSAEDATLKAAEARVPKPAKLGAADPLAVRAIHRQDGGQHPRIVVDVATPKTAAVDLFAEGPTPDWALPLPEPVGTTEAGLRQFAFDLDGLPAGANPKGAQLTLTLVAGGQAIEVKTHLD